MENRPKPKRKLIGYKQSRTVTGGEGNSKVDLNLERGRMSTTYAPTTKETGHKAYGKVGGGTDPEMNRLLAKARTERRDVTDISSKGLTYAAGKTTVSETPSKLSASISRPKTLPRVEYSQKKVYEYPAKKMPKLKAMAVTRGGSDRSANPSNKSGIGSASGHKTKFKLRTTKSFPKR